MLNAVPQASWCGPKVRYLATTLPWCGLKVSNLFAPELSLSLNASTASMYTHRKPGAQECSVNTRNDCVT